MAAVVADTHAAVWYFLDDPRLSRRAGDVLDAAIADGGMHISSVTIVELVYLIERARVPPVILDRLLAPDFQDGIVPVPLDFVMARHVAGIPREVSPEMADRMIAATALALGVPLVTRDRRLRRLDIETIW